VQVEAVQPGAQRSPALDPRRGACQVRRESAAAAAARSRPSREPTTRCSVLWRTVRWGCPALKDVALP
jgi:hypothetical protein